MIDAVTLVGLLASTLTTVAFLPQLTKTWKSKTAKDISPGMLSTFCTGVFLWLIYGILIHSLPVMLANLITLVLASSILVFKIKYGYWSEAEFFSGRVGPSSTLEPEDSGVGVERSATKGKVISKSF